MVVSMKDDADYVMVQVKEWKMAQQQQEQLKSEIVKLKGMLKEKDDSLLAEKERIIQLLQRFVDIHSVV